MKAVNLLPTDQKGSVKTSAASATPVESGGGAFGAYAVLGALAFAVVAVALSVLAGNKIKEREAELASVTKEAEQVQAQAASLQAFADFAQLSDSRVSTIKALAASRFDWPRTLEDLSRALPSQVRLTELAGTTATGITNSGGNQLRGAVSAPAVELKGCANSQAGVAKLMSRLRDVRGVTRVSLSKSVKPDVVETTVAGSAGAPTTDTLCSEDAPPDFEVVVFFERSAVPAAASPNAPAPDASGAVAQPAGSAAATPAPGTAAAPAASPAASATATPSTSATQGVSAP